MERNLTRRWERTSLFENHPRHDVSSLHSRLSTSVRSLSSRLCRTGIWPLLFALGLFVLPKGLQAQTPVTKAKDSNGTVLFQINEDAGLVVNGDGTDSIPATGAGIRMMWDPDKAAFRAGEVGNETRKEDVWDPDSIGEQSVAVGEDSRASRTNSAALGQRTVANGMCRFSIDQFGELKWRMSAPIAQQHRHRVAA